MTADVGHSTQHMYTSSGIRFRDPFGSEQSRCDSQAAAAAAAYFAHSRGLDSSTTSHSSTAHQSTRSKQTLQFPAQQPHDLVASLQPLQRNVQDVVPVAPSSVPNFTTMSPSLSVRTTQNDDQSRRSSTVSAIAPSFQIPRSVNDSGGSLSELAAEIACLFWFESAELLESIEQSPAPTPANLQPLSPDARPTTGFRKWVTTILSTTLVAQNVVILALLFVYRLKRLNPTVRGKPGSEYRLLTVALMLGNKFLDDNTYTNKTWAEVSGINVSEVLVMEVEFLSNMKYCLYTSAEDWSKWQTLLGRFAGYVERSKNPPPLVPAPNLPSILGLQHTGISLPSPPPSNQASPPYSNEWSQNVTQNPLGPTGPSPAPSPLTAIPEHSLGVVGSRKRSLDDASVEMPAKRAATYSNGPSPRRPTSSSRQVQNAPRLPLPNLAIPANTSQPVTYSYPHQLPAVSGLLTSARTMATSHPASTAAMTQLAMPQGMNLHLSGSQPIIQGPSQLASRQHSPYGESAVPSPSTALPHSAASLHPPAQISPSYFLQQRNSPYRPIHNVSTLLYPPPSGALQHRATSVEQSQMHYQPLGKTLEHQQTGRLPYVAQNIWVDGLHPQAMTPINQWSSFSSNSKCLLPQQVPTKQ